MNEGTNTISLRLLNGFALSVGRSNLSISASARRLVAFFALDEGSRARVPVAVTLGSLLPQRSDRRGRHIATR